MRRCRWSPRPECEKLASDALCWVRALTAGPGPLTSPGKIIHRLDAQWRPSSPTLLPSTYIPKGGGRSVERQRQFRVSEVMEANNQRLLHTFAALADLGQEIANTADFAEMLRSSFHLLLGSIAIRRG